MYNLGCGAGMLGLALSMVGTLEEEKDETSSKPPIRLAQVIYALEIGGSEMLAWRIAKALNRERRYICSIYSAQESGTLAHILPAEGISTKGFSRRSRFDLRLILRMTKLFRAERIQILHTHHLGQLLYGGLAGRLAGARVVHTEHEYYTLKLLRHRRLLRVLSGLTDAVTAVAEPVTQFLRTEVGIPGKKLSTIPNGVDVIRFSTAKPTDRKALGWQETDVVIGCIARLEPEKGHAILLESFRQIHTMYPHARLLLVGDGTERSRLEQLSRQFGLKDSLFFTGIRRDIPELLATCDMVVLASVHEGLPIAILEAMAAGKPIVATRVGSIPQVVLNGKTGFLVQPEDPCELTKALKTLIADKLERQRLGYNAFDLVNAYYSFDRTVSQYTALYDAALAKRRH
jgi:glycosyltransferase involved in cell wall biosynthesis